MKHAPFQKRPSLKTRLAERRAKNLELAIQDAMNRCTQCRRAFVEIGVIVVSDTTPGRFCSEDCLADATHNLTTSESA